MHLGLIGGIGPAATVAYYTRLVAEFRTADLPLKLTIIHADMTVLAHNASTDQRQAQAEVFAGHLNQLAAAGCDIGMITALTGHFCFEETRQLSPIQLVDGTEVIDRHCDVQGIKTLGLLGSPPVLNTKLFGLLKASEIVVPKTGLDELGQAYMEVAYTGICTDENRSKFFQAGASMIENQDAEAVLLAGTDLGLAFNGQTPGFKVIDALELHVQELVSLASKTRSSLSLIHI